jgi:hypothetical protein
MSSSDEVIAICKECNGEYKVPNDLVFVNIRRLTKMHLKKHGKPGKYGYCPKCYEEWREQKANWFRGEVEKSPSGLSFEGPWDGNDGNE